MKEKIAKLKERLAKQLILWLLRYTPEWMVLKKSKWGRTKVQMRSLIQQNSAIKVQAAMTVASAEKLVMRHNGLQADYDRLKEDAKTVLTEELLAENEQYRRDAEAAKAAYDALLEEFAQLTEGRTW